MAYPNQQAGLLVANGWKHDSKIVKLDKGLPITFCKNAAFNHPYGLAFIEDTLYVTSQNNLLIATVSLTTGQVIDPAFTTIEGKVRGIASDSLRSRLFVAGHNVVKILDSTNATVIRTIPFDNPIGVYFHAPSNSLLVGSNADAKGLVHRVDLATFHVDATPYQTPHGGMDHPAGLLVYGDFLYALGQDNRQLLKFDFQSKEYKGKLIEDLPNDPEQILAIPQSVLTQFVMVPDYGSDTDVVL
ncbi:hypothetical protein CYMTET_53407 [Cymbomonas tetramitiformis]|uniref:Uncharacterized protein n=1 Tax=Cymbomonas tetramitiformis TaxID=36881 RepID=A0AAE0BGY5_9CHLO|nr:hypothetical protein CYMTET_53407 [Cymbomonas tetramitiformis]